MLLAVVAACGAETVEVPGETVVVEKEVVKTVEVPGETVVVEKEVVKTVEVPGETVTVEVVKEVQVPGETVVVEKEVVKTVEVPGETVVVEKEVVKTVEVPGETVVVEKEVVRTVEVPGPERVMVKEVRMGYVTDPTTGKVFTAPQYGGTLTIAKKDIFNPTADPYYSTAHATHSMLHGVLEKLGIMDWATPMDEFDRTMFAIPLFTLRGALAESWDISSDGLTYTFPIRKGVYFHDKPPVNGRELTADDIVYNFHRNLAMGEFSEAKPTTGLQFQGWDTIPIESITATDKWTVVFKLKRPDSRALRSIIDPYVHVILPREVIEKYGDMKDWRNVVGTGPWMLTEYVEGSSLTLNKNPNYWSYDEKYPGNRLPYIDELRAPYMPDIATRIAALRTGKIDYQGTLAIPTLDTIDKVKSLQRTNPEIVITEHEVRSTNGFGMNTQRPPFDDIRVRKAMNMALDREALHYTYFKGWGSWIPEGAIAGVVPVAGIPFEEWPEEVKKGYMYDPAGAEKLLDEAGYPRGADGIRFKTSLTWSDSNEDTDYLELIAATYYRDIGVDVEVKLVPSVQLVPLRKAADFDMFFAVLAATGTQTPLELMVKYTTGHQNNASAVNDPVYDAVYETATKVSTEEEQLPFARELNMYAIERYWAVVGQVKPWISVTQPWVKGHNGELIMGNLQFGYTIAARLWINQEVKEAMGH